MKNTTIPWCDHTWNPWIGCTKVSPGCDHCFAERYGRRFGVKWGPGEPRRRTSAAYWRQLLAWDRTAKEAAEWCNGEPPLPVARPRVFCGSLMDWLDPEVPIEWLVDLLEMIRRTPNINWQLLSKRPELWFDRTNAVASMLVGVVGGGELHAWIRDWQNNLLLPANVWVGATVEDQPRADERIPALLAIPAKVRFLSCEPLLGPLDLGEWLSPPEHSGVSYGGQSEVVGGGSLIDWVICGGESGPHARPMHPDWARSLRDQCQAAGVPFFFNQWHSPEAEARLYAARVMNLDYRNTEKNGGSHLDGREWKEFPR